MNVTIRLNDNVTRVSKKWHGLKKMNEMDHGLKLINDNVTKVEVM